MLANLPNVTARCEKGGARQPTQVLGRRTSGPWGLACHRQGAASWGSISVLRVLCRRYECGSPTHGAAPATHQHHLLWEHSSQQAMGALALGSPGPAQPAAGRGVHSQRHRDGSKRVCCVHGELTSGWHAYMRILCPPVTVHARKSAVRHILCNAMQRAAPYGVAHC